MNLDCKHLYYRDLQRFVGANGRSLKFDLKGTVQEFLSEILLFHFLRDLSLAVIVAVKIKKAVIKMEKQQKRSEIVVLLSMTSYYILA